MTILRLLYHFRSLFLNQRSCIRWRRYECGDVSWHFSVSSADL